MTILAVRPRLLWAGSGSTDSIDLEVDGVPITYRDTSHIRVRQRINATGAVTDMTEGVDYTIEDDTLTRSAGNLPSGYVWAIWRESPKAQEVDLPQGGDFSSSDVEALGDIAVEQIQDLADAIDRAFKLSVFADEEVSSELPAPSAGKLLAWDPTAQALVNMSPVEAGLFGLISEFMQSVVQAANAAAARSLLEITAANLGITAADIDDTYTPEVAETDPVTSPLPLRLQGAAIHAKAHFDVPADGSTDATAKLTAFFEEVAGTGKIGVMEPGTYLCEGTPALTPVSDVAMTTIRAYGAIIRTDPAAQEYGFRINRGTPATQIDQAAYLNIHGLLIDHGDHEEALGGFWVRGRPHVHFIDCRVNGGSFDGGFPGMYVNYAAFQFQQGDDADAGTGPFWCRIIRPRIGGGDFRIPYGVRTFGSVNALVIQQHQFWNIATGVLLTPPENAVISDPSYGYIANAPEISGGAFEGMDYVARYLGITGVSTPAGLSLHHNYIESIDEAVVDLSSIDTNHADTRLAPMIGPNHLLIGSAEYIRNPNGLRLNVRDELVGYAAINPAETAANASATIGTIEVTGAAVGDFVMIDAHGDLGGLVATGYVSDVDEVTVRLVNGTNGAINLGELKFRARVRPLGNVLD